ncbi:MAG TPA: DUF5667 domain-containing protein [Anaerolineae bacterium]|nr:DUF5667 domain-containing protein [Anaerolineae bacterium]
MDRFEAVLDESISALQAGIPIEEILAEAPDYAGELRPLLYAAQLVTDPQPQAVPEERKQALRAQYLTEAVELSPISPTLTEKGQAILNIMRRRFSRRAMLNDLVTVGVTIVLTLVMSFLVLSYAAQDSLPGDMLYTVKRVTESARLTLTFEKDSRAALVETFNHTRILEIEELIRQKRAAMVDFSGILETKGKNLWVIEGLTVFVPEDIGNLEADLQEGDPVEVIGLLRTNTILLAESIQHVDRP